MNSFIFTTVASLVVPLPSEVVRGSIEKGIARLEAAAGNYVRNRDCFSCHHQAIPLLAFASARTRGFKIEADLIPRQREFSLKSFGPRVEEIRRGRGVGGGNTMAAYGLYSLRISGHPRDETTKALVQYLLGRQREDGGWSTSAKRPPSEGSPFTSTGLALECLQMELGEIVEESERRPIREAMKRGVKFLEATKSETNEDRVFQLRGAVAGGAGGNVIAGLRNNLRKMQNADGGWSQLTEMSSDAYATGTALVALRKGGLSADDLVYRRGVKFLCTTQDKTGVWIVQTRSRPIQTYFDNGDPGGKSQFISTAATGWAVLALLETVEPIKDNPR